MSCSMITIVRAAGRKRDQALHRDGLLRAHAGGRLVEQQHRRPGRQREPDLELALGAVGQRARRGVAIGRQPDVGRQRVRAVLHGAITGERRPEPVPHAVGDRARGRQALADRHVGEQIVGLERARQPGAGARIGAGARQVPPPDRDRAGVGRQLAGQ